MDPGVAKNTLSDIHTAFLCGTYHLVKEPWGGLSLNGFQPDVFDIETKTVYEIKTSAHPKPEPESQHYWWSLDTVEIDNYLSLQKRGIGFNWIFVLATLAQRASSYEQLSEADVLERKLFVAPYDAFLAAKKGELYIQADHGGLALLHVSLPRLKDRYKDRDRYAVNGEKPLTLYLAKSLDEKVKAIFAPRLILQ